MDEYCKRSGQIPAFGNWDYSNELPITQYFESARQAGLVRYSSSSGESDPCNMRVEHDLYALDFNKKPVNHRNMPPSTLRKGMRNRERRCTHVTVKEGMNMRKQGKVWDVTEHPRKQHDGIPPRHGGGSGGASLPARAPKPVDEDLYKIPPELLRTTKRKKMLGFISKCLVPAACVS